MLAIQVLLFDRLQRQLQPAVLVVGGFVLMTAGFAFMASATAYGVVVVLVAVIALGSGVLLPTLNVAMVEKAGSAVGTAVGYQAAASNLGQAAGSAAIGLLFIVKPNASFTFVAVATFLAAVAAGILARLRGARLSER
jgi:predicted MFS family arabinose efflux permease